MNDVSPFIDFVRSVYPMSREADRYFRGKIDFKKILRGKYLLKPGEDCHHFYFIHKGITRSFRKDEGKEITTWINHESEIITSIRCLAFRDKSIEYIQALEDCELYVLNYKDMDKMYELFPEMNTFARLILQAYYVDSEERAYISKLPGANKKYKFFVDNYPGLINRVPLKYIASFLGITNETLSRLRGRREI